MSYFRRLASRFDDWLDQRRMKSKQEDGQQKPVAVVVYPGWGNEKQVWIKGSVVERDRLEKPDPQDSVLGDLTVTIKRFMASEIMGATVRITFGPASVVCTTDSDGFFQAALPVHDAGTGWRDVEVVLEDYPGRGDKPPLTTTVQALFPSSNAGFGVISDIDDTILKTGISEPLKNWRTIIESDAEARVAFPGLPELYRALQGKAADNPIFYVSSGSWKLYDLIARFKQINEIPLGPVFMDDWGIDEDHWVKSSHGAHKVAAIERILETYPALDFILVGDSGQHDAEIYADALQKHGHRIKAIWIRDVSGAERDAAVAEVLTTAREAGVPVWAEPDLQGAAHDAAERGWITEAGLATVQDAIAEAAKS